MSEFKRRIENSIKNYECALMNNTKWKEVLDIISSEQLPIQFSFVKHEQFMPEVIFPEGGCETEYTKDCCIHGPFYLKEIFAIRSPRFQRKIRSQTGEQYLCENRFNLVLNKLAKLGELPIEINREGFTIYGYRKKS